MKKFLFSILCLFCAMMAQAQGEETTLNVVFANYAAGSQYAQNEEHVLSEDVVLYTTSCHFTTELRIYSSTTNNGFAIGKVAGTIKSMSFNAGYKADKLLVYGSSDGENWQEVGGIKTTTTSYKDYTLDFGETAYSYFKLDVDGSNQIRIKSMTITYLPSVEGTVTPSVTAPVITESCIFTEPMEVSLFCATDDATIHYTTDGSEPTKESDEYKGPFTITETTTVKAIAVKEGMKDSKVVEATYTKVEPSSWKLVTDEAALNVGDKVVIASAISEYAMSTNQKDNNRGAVKIIKSDDDIIINDEVQILTLEEGENSGTFAFNIGGGYLYAASSDNNYLRTDTKKDANGSWKITIASDGVASIVAQGANSRNVMRYNQSSTLFSCYQEGNSQKDVSLYYKATEVNINKYGYATLFLDKAVAVPEGLTAYYCTVNGTTAVLNEVGEVIPAATGVVLKGEANTTYTLANTAEVNGKAETIEAENRLIGYAVDTEVAIGGNSYYALNVKNSVVGFFVPQTMSEDNSTFTAKANKAYLKVEGAANAQMLTIREGADGGETSVESVLTDASVYKVYYDLTGRRVVNPKQGIYIVNGRKVVIR